MIIYNHKNIGSVSVGYSTYFNNNLTYDMEDGEYVINKFHSTYLICTLWNGIFFEHLALILF